MAAYKPAKGPAHAPSTIKSRSGLNKGHFMPAPSVGGRASSPKKNYVAPPVSFKVFIRSFIADKAVGGGYFRGDGRGPSTNVDSNTTSRIIHSFTVNLNTQTISDATTKSDYTRFRFEDFVHEETAIPSDHVDVIRKKLEGMNLIRVSSDYKAKDPITPSFGTPNVDIHSNFMVSSVLSIGVVNISLYLVGDIYPSLEAFIQDSTGKNKVFLGTHMQQGNLHSLFFDNRKTLIDVRISILISKKGEFLKVRKDEREYSISEWNGKFTR